MDWSKFFATYIPNIYKAQEPLKISVDTSAITNPYSDIDLGTHLFTDKHLNSAKPLNIWDSIGWTSGSTNSKVTNTTSEITDDNEDFTIESYRNKNKLGIGELTQNAANLFAKTFAPIIQTSIRNLNSNKKLGMTKEQIEEATRRITFYNAMESAYGTSPVANQNNNLGGVKYTSWQQEFGGSNGYLGYTKYPGVKAFYNALINHLFGGRYKEALFATSDREFIDIMKKNNYFEADANLYYSNVFNTLNKKAWYAYKNPELR